MRRSTPILERWLQVRPDERRRWLALAAFALAAGSGAGVARIGANALFLARLPVELIAWRYAAAGAAVAAALLLHWGLVGTVRRDRVAAGTAVAAAVSGLALYAAIAQWPRHPGVLAATYAWADVFEALAIVQIVDLAGVAFGPRPAAKWLGAAGLAGASLAGGAVAFGRPADVTSLVWIAAALGAVAAVAVLDAGRQAPGFPPDRSLAPPAPSVGEDLGRLARSRLPLAVGVAGGIAALGVTVADYLLAVTVRGLGEPVLAVFYGGFALWTYGLALMVRRLLARRVLERFGVLVGLLVLPGAMAAGLIATVASAGALWAVTATRIAGTAFAPATVAAERVLFLPVSPDFRPRAVALVRGLVAPAATLVAGLALVAFPSGPGSGYALVIGLVTVLLAGVAWAIATWRFYLRSLRSVLRGRSRSAARLRTQDQGTRLSLSAALHETRESRLLHVFELMEALEDPRVWTDASLHLLQHESPLVRIRALHLLARGRSRRHAERVRALLDDRHPEVRAAAVEAWCETARFDGADEVKARLADPHPAVRAAVVLGLSQVGGAEGVRIAGEELRRMVIATDPQLRAAAAKVLATFYTPTLRELLLTLLADPAPDVRNAALAVAGGSGDAHLLPKLVVALQDRRTATAAAQALSKFGHDVERDIGFALEDARRPIPTRQHLARILARMRTPLAAQVLEERIGMAPVPVRQAVHASLARLSGMRGVRIDVRRVDLAIAAEVGTIDEWIGARRDLAGVAEGTLLDEATRLRIDRTVERVVHLLRVRWPERSASLDRALVTWRDGDEQQRLHARELLRHLLRHDLRPQLMGWLEGEPTSRKPPRAAREWIEDLLRSHDEWLKICTVHLVGVRRLADHRDGVEDVVVEPVPELVRDAVHLTLARLDGAEPPPGDPRMFTTVEKVLYLKGVSLFARIPAEDLVGVAEIAKPVWFEPRQVVFQRGDDGDSLYLVVYGEAEVVVGERVLATLGPGEVFGEMALLDAEPRMAGVRAITDLRTLRIGRDEFLDLVDDQPEVLKGIVKVLTARLRNAHGVQGQGTVKEPVVEVE